MSKPSSLILLTENFKGRPRRTAHQPIEGDLHSGKFFCDKHWSALWKIIQVGQNQGISPQKSVLTNAAEKRRAFSSSTIKHQPQNKKCRLKLIIVFFVTLRPIGGIYSWLTNEKVYIREKETHFHGFTAFISSRLEKC